MAVRVYGDRAARMLLAASTFALAKTLAYAEAQILENDPQTITPVGYKEEPVLNRLLDSDERLLWSGQPQQGVLLRGTDLFQVPFSLMWCGFALFWEYSVVTSNAPMLFRLWGVPFVAVGLYMVFGRFIADSRVRAQTVYGVTSKRIIITRSSNAATTTSIGLKTLGELSFSEHRGGVGTIFFGSVDFVAERYRGMQWPGMTKRLAPAFERIAGANDVYRLIRKAQEEVQSK